ncbi:MAG: hypothetical protein HY775_07025 [Acidobacteria bacterium]|nr:hypothetical protein [Acidobacteriota bacterium]
MRLGRPGARALAAVAALGALLPASTDAIASPERPASCAAGAPSGPAPVGASPCSGVRPGAIIGGMGGGGCTANFLFAGSDGRRYMGTAGHCVQGQGVADLDRTWKPGKGPEVMLEDQPLPVHASAIGWGGRRIGEVAYAAHTSSRDFALVRLDRGVPASPALCHFGGPTGTYSGVADRFEPALYYLYGNGVGLGSVAPGRTLVGGRPMAESNFTVFGLVAFGDSGSPVILSDGRAVGVLSGESIPDGYGIVLIQRLPWELTHAQKALRIRLRLLTAPLETQLLPSLPAGGRGRGGRG